jgi:hypothetical protein
VKKYSYLKGFNMRVSLSKLKIIFLSAFAVSFIVSCKGIDDDSQKAGVKNITVLEDRDGREGLLDLSFESAGDCANGGVLFNFYVDKNNSGHKESSEGSMEKYRNCNIEGLTETEMGKSDLAPNKAISGNAFMTSPEDLSAYLSANPDSKSIFNILDPDFDTYSDYATTDFPLEFKRPGFLHYFHYPEISTWDFAVLNFVKTEKVIISDRSILNFESVYNLSDVDEVTLNGIAITTSQAASLTKLPKLSRLHLGNTVISGVTDWPLSEWNKKRGD